MIAQNSKSQGPHGSWTFLTNHSHVLFCLAEDPHARLRDVALRVGITERAVQSIVADLEGAGIITRSREGRRNYYKILRDKHLRHPVEAHCRVRDLLSIGRATDRPGKAEAAPNSCEAGLRQ